MNLNFITSYDTQLAVAVRPLKRIYCLLRVPGSCMFNALSICFLGQTHETLKGKYPSQTAVVMEIKALGTPMLSGF